MNVHSAGKPGCAVCLKPVKRDATPKLCSGCANLVHVTCIPANYNTALCYKCTSFRDEIISHTLIPKEKSAATTWNAPGTSKISCRALWPREVYQQYEKALVVAKNLNYESPMVKNLTVCMRENRTSFLIPINSELEFNALILRASPAN
ncbi:hypothetical protein QAD02_003699 [Eretmocerus hayati]|uniref:Uncharacterized protein n=1 Tax=Eretmocerus hayati TaxID=131215 RepID=A0ACC2NMQ7_9HYME|nr:hypothetical protein QAD02_003699 [Eretmocerus hayati]